MGLFGAGGQNLEELSLFLVRVANKLAVAQIDFRLVLLLQD